MGVSPPSLMVRPAGIPRTCRIARNPRAFTLIEVLIVVAVLALLVGLMLPALSKSRQSAQITACTVNLRQLITASLMYVGDNRDVFPDPAWDPPMPVGYRGWLYVGKIADVIKNGQGSSTGSLWTYLGGEPDLADLGVQKTYRCPAHKPPWRAASTSDNITSYLMNGAVRGFGREKVSFRVDRFRPDAWIFWETDEWVSGWNDGSSYPDQGLSKRHGQQNRNAARYDNAGATIAVIDGGCRWVSRVLYDEELKNRPGRLWCNPGRKTGD